MPDGFRQLGKILYLEEAHLLVAPAPSTPASAWMSQ